MSIRTKRNIGKGAPDVQTRTDHEYTWLVCSACQSEEVRVPKNVEMVTCGWCIQHKVEPPRKPLSTEERIAKMKADCQQRIDEQRSKEDA